MTVINLETLGTVLGGTAAIDGHILATQWAGRAPVHRTVGDQVIVPESIQLDLTDGVPDETFDLEATDGTFCWRILLTIPRASYRVKRYVAVPSSGPVDWEDLVDVDPETFEPSATAVTAWEAAIAEVEAIAASIASGEQLDPGVAALVPDTDTATGAALAGLITATIATELDTDQTISGSWRFSTSMPTIKGASESAIAYNTGISTAAAWQVSVTGAGRIAHFVIADNTYTGALIGLGLDYGNSSYPQGIIAANKAQSRGIVVDNQSTVADAAAYGLYVRNSSTAAPGAAYEQNVAGAAVALRILSLQANAGQKMIDFRSNTGSGTTEEAGHIRADNGWFIWNKLIKPGTVTTATRPTGLGASTRGSQVYDTDLQSAIIFTDLSWRRMLHGPTTPVTITGPTGGATVDTEARAAIASIITALQGVKVAA